MSGTVDSPGIIPFALDEVFNCISKSQNREFLLRVSYMEIYNEIITDLLNPKSTNLRIRENVDREISVEKLTERVVTSVDEIIDVMKVGEKNRHIGGTNMNEKSSRSHTIFRMVGANLVHRHVVHSISAPLRIDRFRIDVFSNAALTRL